MANASDLEKWAAALEASDDYRVLRKLRRPLTEQRELRPDERLAVIVDTETTGLNVHKDQAIELGMVAFTYGEDDAVLSVIDTMSGFQAPSEPISREITELTGITNDMVRGMAFDVEAIERFIAPASLVIAHNAAFDRPFCERISPIFADKAWACSANEVSWRSLGFDGTKLSYLIAQAGYFHDGHRALDDSIALFQVLISPSPKNKIYPLAALLDSARKTRYRIHFEAPYELREVLRRRGYRWNAGTDAQIGRWHLEVPEASLATELDFLRSKHSTIDRSLSVDRLTAFNRFRSW